MEFLPLLATAHDCETVRYILYVFAGIRFTKKQEKKPACTDVVITLSLSSSDEAETVN